MRRSSLLLVPILAVALAACSSSGTPSTTPSNVQQTVSQAVCDAQAKVLEIVGKVQASSLQSKADLVTQLQLLQAELSSQADTLQSKGQGAAATQVRNVADAVGQLSTAVNGTDPAAVVTAAARVADAIRAVPGCPSSSPSA